jgi:hypothetical protein
MPWSPILSWTTSEAKTFPLLNFNTLNLAVRRFDAKALEGVSMHAWPFVVTIGVTAPVAQL